MADVNRTLRRTQTATPVAGAAGALFGWFWFYFADHGPAAR